MRNKKSKHFSAKVIISAVIIMTFMLSLIVPITNRAANNTVVDDATADNWHILNYNTSEGRTTKNDGRIWTDKSVYNENAKVLKNESEYVEIEKSETSDFMVGLSALASTMSVDGVSSKPFDIIMVLDVSGSMAEHMEYDEVYADEMTYQGTYYIERNNGYTELSYSYNRGAWYYETWSGNVWVTPKTSADDTTNNAVQVYEEVSKMEVLAESVKNFVNTTEEANSKVISTDKQHRIAITKFSGNISNSIGNSTYNDGGHTYNYSQIVKGFTAPTDDATTKSLNDAVDSLVPAGATRADSGMEVAKGLMDSVRENAQPVVIFFTDGVPTTFSEWSNNVANNAIGNAKEMKDDGAWIYSVGVFENADPTGNGNLDRYMNAVSSNYPNATGFTTNSMGNKAQNANYYQTANDADKLKEIFANIATEISGKAAEVPTHVEDGYDASKGGHVTFVDTLGDYMKVSSFNSIVFGGVEYKNTITSDAWKNADSSTNVFVNTEKVTNDLEEEVSIDSVVVTIERSSDARKGDIITVKVPAALVPLAKYEVTMTEEGAITKRIPTTPIRAFYEVSLKDEANDLLKNPDEDMADYLKTYMDEDGKVAFYSNAYDASTNQEIGSTVATFIPSKTNDMYYAVDDTFVFSDEACTKPVTRINESATYYYKRVYYVESTTPVAPKDEIVAFSASVLRNVNYDFDENGQLYVKAGTGRYTRVDAADTAKATNANKTGTAAKAAAPRWEDWNVPGSDVPVYLGNNGMMKLDVPGTLAISKKVVVPEWSTVVVSEKDFTFDVTLKDESNVPIEGTFKAQLKAADGSNVGDAFNVVTDDEGIDSITLKADQTLYIYGLPDGTTYTVKETDNPEGFKQTAPTDDSGQPQSSTGVITPGETSVAAFENTYRATGTLEGKTSLIGKKILNGRDWRDSDIFAFALAPENANNPMPEGAKLIDDTYMALAKVTGTGEDKQADRAFHFNDIVYTEPGTYLYDIREVIISGEADRVMGVSYSQDVYEVTVVVSDNGDGSLTAVSTMKKFNDGTDAASADFTNVFETGKVSFGIVGMKHLIDEADVYEPVNDSIDDDFTFQLTAVTPGAPMPTGTVGGIYTTTNKGVSVSFGTIDCTLSKETIESAGGEVVYTYNVKEIPGNLAGMTYDPKDDGYEVKVTFTWDDTDGLLYKITYPTSSGDNRWVTFTNTYELNDASITLDGVKYLTGRDWEDNETFDFVLEGLDGAPMPEAAQGDAVYEFKVSKTGSEEGIGDKGTFSHTIKYDKPGTYNYKIYEAAGTAGGMTYDTHVSNITVVVTNGGAGSLVAEKTVEPRIDMSVDEGVSGFINKYEAQMTYPGITVKKTLYGRSMTFGEFDFVITAANPNAVAKGIDASDSNFESGAHPSGEACTMDGKLSGMVFTQEDAGKEFVYTVNEVLPTDEDSQHEGIQSNGVTYDETKYWVVIVPENNGDGTMDTVTTIYKDEERNNAASEISFVNEYGFEDVTIDTEAEALFEKVFQGRDWLDTDIFEFKMSVVQGSKVNTPLPAGAVDGVVTVTVGKPATGNQAVVDFGTITFTEAGEYEYNVVETKGTNDTIDYDTHVATLTVTVTDNGLGNLIASTEVENGTFTNTYSDKVTYGDITSLDVTKSLEGRELRERQFAFRVKALDIPSMRKVGITNLENGMEFRNGAPGIDGISHMFSPDNLEFTEKDLGITYSYTFSEINAGVKGYTYDSNEYTLKMTAFYEDGKIKVRTEVTDQNSKVLDDVVAYEGMTNKPVVTIAFKNSYQADVTRATIEGTKEMTGRKLVEDEFEFALAYAGDSSKQAITVARNAADGKVVFAAQEYTLDFLKQLVTNGYAVKNSEGMTDTYTISYTAYEKAGNQAGITHTDATFACAVTVTDKGEGELTAVVNYPQSGLAFKNTYAAETIPYAVKGIKILNSLEGLTPDSIEGKFTFTLTAKTPNAPIPAKTEAHNDALGNVDFGEIQFDSDDLKDAEQQGKVRTKVFTYEVKETGTAPGVTNDTVSTKTFTITVTDNGEGKLTVVANPAEGPVFTFTNTYESEKITESITGQGNLTVTKKLNGRDMKAGEFKFELVEGDKVVANGTNKADGAVDFEAITYDKPGKHLYTVKEVKGNLNGVTYDTKTYQVEAVVTDNGKGQLEVAFSIVDDGVTEIVFTNEYKPLADTLTLILKKELKGRELKAGEFNFKLTAVTNGAPMPQIDTVANNASGDVNFGEITYTEAGNWEYKISEVKGNVEHVTYDETVHNMKVVVTDNAGQLEAKVTFDGKDEVSVFVNKYEIPNTDKPSVPEEPNGSAVNTGDYVNILTYALLCVASLVLVVFCVSRKHKR